VAHLLQPLKTFLLQGEMSFHGMTVAPVAGVALSGPDISNNSCSGFSSGEPIMSQSSNMKRHVRAGAKEMRHAARHVRKSASDEADSVIQSARDAGNHFADAVKSGVNNLRGTASDYLDQGRAKAYDMEQVVEHRIQDRPLNSILMALGAGFVLGFIFTRRG
jgi:ElaB/YqjD/DUF883 family membrane-anchored ribosome-binding protein